MTRRSLRRWAKWLGASFLALVFAGAALVAAAHVFPAFGAALADEVRAIAGPEVVAWGEDVSYDLIDRVKALVYRDAPPKQFWEEPEAPELAMCVDVPKGQAVDRFSPKPFAPPFPKLAGKTDGTWAPVGPYFAKTIVHPDDKRGYAAVAVVAMDLPHLDLSLVAGTVEPVSTLVTAEQRPGLVPASALPGLVAAFNGGWKAEHGHYGMTVDGVVVLPSRDHACTVALMDDGSVKIGEQLGPEHVRSSRQTPPCLVEAGLVDDRTSAESSKRWGAAVGGATVIRRSAVGVSADGKTLFFGLGDSVTAGALARAMKAAGAENVAQLDVNAAYPRFLFFSQAKDGPAVSDALIPDLAFDAHEYLKAPEARDFFYVTVRGATAPAVAVCAPRPGDVVTAHATKVAKAGHKVAKCKRGRKCRSEMPSDADSVAT